MEKRGQFYFVSAIIIALIISVLTGVSTYIVIKEEPKAIEELTKDLNRESFKLIEYGVYNNENINVLLTDFAENRVRNYFQNKAGKDSFIFFIYGNRKELKALQYDSQISGDITLGSVNLPILSDNINIIDFDEENIGESINVNVLGNQYSFELKDNEMFYFIVVSERKKGEDKEVFVEKNIRTREEKNVETKFSDNKVDVSETSSDDSDD